MRPHLTHNVFLAIVLALNFVLTAALPASEITDGAWLTGSYWDDGQAEIAFYDVERTHDQYGRPADQRFPVGTYLVKHEFDPTAEAKASGTASGAVPSFKYAVFYEFESGAYQYKRSYVTNAAQADLTPLKTSLVSFDWCSNLYREMAFRPDGTVAALVRSDDYGNKAEEFPLPGSAYPVAELPLVVRSLDFSSTDRQSFAVLLDDGSTVGVRADLIGREDVTTRAGNFETEKIRLSYEGKVPSLAGERADAVEHYWRAAGPGRLLVRLEADSGRYRMTLIEALRSAYWRENFFPRLKNVTVRP